MAQNINLVAFTGNLKGKVTYGVSNNERACSFELVSTHSTLIGVRNTFVRVNVYGDHLVRVCEERLELGALVEVDGQLMNRRSAKGNELVEIRARDLAINPGKGERNGTETVGGPRGA